MKITCPHCEKTFNKTKKELFPPKPADPDAKKIAEVIEIFVVINPSMALQYGHKGHRTAIRSLFDVYGIEKTFELANACVVLKNIKDLYKPIILTPSQLFTKASSLVMYIEKTRGSELQKV